MSQTGSYTFSDTTPTRDGTGDALTPTYTASGAVQPSFSLPEKPVWEEGIYQLEVTDRVLGYDPRTGEDGPSNVQWLALGNRTQYLRKLLDKDHDGGRHGIRNANFLDATRIPESALALDYETSRLMQLIRMIAGDTDTQRARADGLANINLSFSGALLRLIPYSQEYSGWRLAFELFTDYVTSRSFSQTVILKEIAGDDSLDVADTTGVREGVTYILSDEDGGRAEEVTVMSVLTDRRIRFTTDLQVTRTTGVMSATNLRPNDDGAGAHGDFVYYTDELDVYENAQAGKLYLHRDAGFVNRDVTYRLAGSDAWQSAVFDGTVAFVDGTVDDVFRLPPGRMTVRIAYSGGNYPYTVYYIVFKPIHPIVWIEDIRRPEVVSATISGPGVLTVTGNRYASLYDIDQAGAEVVVQPVSLATSARQTSLVTRPVNEVSFQLTDDLLQQFPLRARIRYTDVEGAVSRWSQAAYIEL